MQINRIVAAGVVGIRFDVKAIWQRDSVAKVDGFATIDYLSEGEMKVCRSMCRRIMLPERKPFDKIDAALMTVVSDIDHFARHRYALAGCVALGLKLVTDNPTLNLTPDEIRYAQQLMGVAKRLREYHIDHFGKVADAMWRDSKVLSDK